MCKERGVYRNKFWWGGGSVKEPRGMLTKNEKVDTKMLQHIKGKLGFLFTFNTNFYRLKKLYTLNLLKYIINVFILCSVTL